MIVLAFLYRRMSLKGSTLDVCHNFVFYWFITAFQYSISDKVSWPSFRNLFADLSENELTLTWMYACWLLVMLSITWHDSESQVFGCVLHHLFTHSLQLLPSMEVTCGICGEGQKPFASWMLPCLPDHSWKWEVFARQLVWRTENPSKSPRERNFVHSEYCHHFWVKCNCKKLSDTILISFSRKEVIVTCVNKLKSCVFMFSVSLRSVSIFVFCRAELHCYFI